MRCGAAQRPEYPEAGTDTGARQYPRKNRGRGKRKGPEKDRSEPRTKKVTVG